MLNDKQVLPINTQYFSFQVCHKFSPLKLFPVSLLTLYLILTSECLWKTSTPVSLRYFFARSDQRMLNPKIGFNFISKYIKKLQYKGRIH